MVLSGDTPARRQEWSHSKQVKNIEIDMVRRCLHQIGKCCPVTEPEKRAKPQQNDGRTAHLMSPQVLLGTSPSVRVWPFSENAAGAGGP